MLTELVLPLVVAQGAFPEASAKAKALDELMAALTSVLRAREIGRAHV